MNFIGMARTNTFKVKDAAAFQAAVDNLDARIRQEGDYFTVLFENETLPDSPLSDGDGNEQPSFNHLIANHLAEGEVCVCIMIGYEGMRYLVGEAIAIHSSGETEWCSLADIYDRVEKRWGEFPPTAEY